MTIAGLCQAVYPPFAMLAGMQLDLFTPLAEGPLTAPQLATRLGVDAARLGPLLYALVSAGLLEEEEEAFSNTPEAARFLVRGLPTYMGERHHLLANIWHAALQTAASVRTGRPQAPHDVSVVSIEEMESFLRGLHPRAVESGRQFAADFDLSSCHRLVDVGGGSGGFAIGLAEACGHLQVAVVDMARVTPLTERFVSEADAQARVDVVSADIVDGPPGGTYDAAVMRNFIQVLSPERARRALRHTHEVLSPGGAIYITGDMLDDSRRGPEESVAFNIVFLNIYEAGQAYTYGEYEAWLIEAGFEDITFVSEDMVTARRP